MLNKAKKWGLISVLYNLRKILENQDYRLFNQIVTDPQHCFNIILPPIRTWVAIHESTSYVRQNSGRTTYVAGTIRHIHRTCHKR